MNVTITTTQLLARRLRSHNLVAPGSRLSIDDVATRMLAVQARTSSPREIAEAGPRLRQFDLDDRALRRARSVTESLLGDRAKTPSDASWSSPNASSEPAG